MTDDANPSAGTDESSAEEIDSWRFLSPDGDDDIDERIEDLRSEFQTQIADVKGRIIDVLEETYEKSPTDHGHPSLAEEIDDIIDELDAIESMVSATEERLSALESDRASLQEDLEDFDDRLGEQHGRLDEHADRIRDQKEKLDTLAQAIVRNQRKIATLESASRVSEALDRLKTAANKADVRTADCEKCGQRLTISLLTAPQCPYCEAVFDGVSPPRFFGAGTLETAERPAIEGETTSEINRDDESSAQHAEADGDGSDPSTESAGSGSTDGSRGSDSTGDASAGPEQNTDQSDSSTGVDNS